MSVSRQDIYLEPISISMQKIGFVVNGKKGRKKRLLREFDKFKEQLSAFEVNVQETSGMGDATAIAMEMASSGYTHVIAVGGDGTLNETVNGVKKSARPNCKVGMLTYGTANDFARTVAAPKSLRHLLESIQNDSFETLDLGLIEQKIGDIKYTRYFINIADLGIGAEVVKKVNGSSKFFGGNFTFFQAIVRTFFSYKNQPVKCEADRWQWEGKMNSLVIANGKYFGSGMCIAPEADPADGQFSILICGDISLLDYLRNVRQIRKGHIIKHKKAEYKTARSLKITSPSIHCFIEADGEFVGGVPVTVSIIPGAVAFITCR